ncbi:RNA-binding S4 domain protein [Desulfofarcimen acetoxidans DSM 771]|jgi:ribosomal 50S subunit-recycling heat shock protein|uniref:RQC P-site tRNA stabilizing factor n=1 Tax=Desulfofarcimen acetoxidans (strain ATCC 49208 / DSM 771 / KCTC 5769 / VKM B-1644 / 5575) TaxID=485916 RepID=C8W317_DESAS|nr:RNA-binding S4 domain-containing protein [Desulfofarcimen acetoxidans]ACV61173.1 RNA-binding S4 domain protein [Desulfofarcimen acetoxidans DSM 771]
MRLDKFLKVSRVIKRRTLAKEVCDRGQATLNSRVAKAGSEVKAGDILEINFGTRKIKLEILLVLSNVPAKEASTMYSILEDIRLDF